MKKPAAPKLFKSFFQARYEPQLQFYDLFTAAAAQLDEYPHWRTNRLDITLRDPANHCSLAIKHMFFTYCQDSGDADLESRNMLRADEVLPPALEIETFSRLGILRRYLLPVSTMAFEDLVEVMHVKLLSQNAELRSLLPETIEDLMYRVDAADASWRYHITVGPVRKGEIARALDFNKADHLDPETADEALVAIQTSYPDVAVYFDVDLYHEGDSTPSEALDFIKAGRDRVSELVSDLGEYLLSTKVEAH